MSAEEHNGEPEIGDTLTDLVRKGMANLPRNPDDGVGGALLEDYVVEHMPEPDITAIKRRRAREAIRAQRHHGVTEADGQLTFPELEEPYDYEPQRLVLSDDDSLVEQSRAGLKAKTAESTRARKKADETALQANRRQAEVNAYAPWVVAQIQAGAKDLTFGTYVAALRAAS